MISQAVELGSNLDSFRMWKFIADELWQGVILKLGAFSNWDDGKVHFEEVVCIWKSLEILQTNNNYTV